MDVDFFTECILCPVCKVVCSIVTWEGDQTFAQITPGHTTIAHTTQVHTTFVYIDVSAKFLKEFENFGNRALTS